MKGFQKLLFGVFLMIAATAQAQDAKMKTFVDALMKKMTLEEKIGQLNLLTPGGGILTGAVVSQDVDQKIKNGQVGGLFGVIGMDKIKTVQTIAVTQSRLKIPLLFGSDVIHGYKTTFPIPLGLASSWDIPLIQATAAAAANEASADGLNWAFSPMVDIARDPRWGRVAEGAGEDPYLGSQVSKAMVRGYQGNDLSKNNTLMACVKHFALYGAAEAGRDYNTTDMSLVKMYNDYLPPYKAAVDAGTGSVMSSFNEINGVPATGNKWLLTDLLRKQWGFKGFVVSDYTSLNEMIDHGMGDLQNCSALALNAGLDMDMVGEGFLLTLKKSLAEGKVTLKTIDDACRRILEAKYKLGLFEDPFRYCNDERAKSEVMNTEVRNFTREAARHTFVLLKNDNQLLPLKKTGTIALIGPLADSRENMLGTWAVSGDSKNAVTILEGFKNMLNGRAEIIYAKGANITDDSALAAHVNVFGPRVVIDQRTPDEMIEEAVAAANKAQVVVLVAGEASEMSGEAASRTDLSLPASQKKLIAALKKTGKPIVMVLMSGRPQVIEAESKTVPAILEVWHPGTEAGNAVADVVFGDYNPSGKLTMTFPRNMGQIPIYYAAKNTGRPNDGDNFGKFKSNYIDAPNSPLYPFGYGLSYTKFSYSDLRLSATTMKATENITVSVTVTNTGNYEGEETVQLYTRDLVGSIGRPLKELKGFQKVFLKQGESKEISFVINNEMLKFFNANLKYDSEPGKFQVFIGTSSSETKKGEFELVK